MEVPEPGIITFLASVLLVLRSTADDHLAVFPNIFWAEYARAHLSGEMNHPDFHDATPTPPMAHGTVMRAWAKGEWATPASEVLPQDLEGWHAPGFEAAKLSTHIRLVAQGKRHLNSVHALIWI